MNDLSRKQQIRNLLGIIGFGVLGAFVVSGILLYLYNPSGQYVVKNALLNPTVAESLSYNETESTNNGKSVRFIFDGVEFSYYDMEKKQWQRKALSQEQYKKMYQTIENDVSVQEISPEIEMQFNQPGIATLAINVKTENPASWKDMHKLFQQVQFLPSGDYYRIALREQGNASSKWIYFKHPEISKYIKLSN